MNPITPPRETIHTTAAPDAIGPYSQAVGAGPYVFTSGQIGLDPLAGNLAPGGVESETRQVMANVAAVLAAAGLTFADVVKTTIFLADMNDFAAFNAIYLTYFTGPLPARAFIGSGPLLFGARFELTAIAVSRAQ